MFNVQATCSPLNAIYKSTKQAISGNCKTNHTNHTSNFSESLHAHTLYSVQTQHSVQIIMHPRSLMPSIIINPVHISRHGASILRRYTVYPLDLLYLLYLFHLLYFSHSKKILHHNNPS